MQIKEFILSVVVFSAGVLSSAISAARVATPPSTPDQVLINPALAALRPYAGMALNLNRDLDTTTALGLIDSSLVISTSIDSINANNVWRSQDYTWEFSVAPQSGVKKIVSTSVQNSITNDFSSENKLTLIPVQGLVSKKVSSQTAVGLKVIYSYANFDSTTKYAYSNGEGGSQEISDAEEVKGQFLILAPGVVYQLGTSGLSFSYLAEFMQFTSEDNLAGTNSGTGGGTTSTSITNLKTKDTVSIRKDVVGIGYTTKFSGGNSLRVELSIEKMPPLSKGTFFQYGQLNRFIGELSYSYFQVGTEVTQKQGYYVDPNNLIPYFFKQDQYNKKATTELGFFGGLRTSKGHGVGISFSNSTEDTTEPLSPSGGDLPVEKKTSSYSLSYSYLY